MRRPQPIRGSLDLRRLSPEEQERIDTFFWAKVHKGYDGSPCWRFGYPYPGPLRVPGYVLWKGQSISAYRFSFALLRGPIKKGFYLWRTCGITNCVNPDHLMYGSQSEMEAWYGNRPKLSDQQISELRRAYHMEHTPIYKLRSRYKMTDREVRKILFD